MKRLKTPILWGAFALALLLTVVLATSGLRGAGQFRPAMEREAPIEGWMTPGYVGHSWRVPRKVIRDALSLKPGSGRPGPLDKIAADREVPVDDLIAAVEAAIKKHRGNE